MALTPLRWIAIFVAGALSVAILALTPPTSRPTRVDPAERELSNRLELRTEHVSSLAGRLREKERAESIQVVASRRPAAPFRTFIDAAIPAPLRPELEAFGQRAFQTIGGQPRVGVDIAFVYDTLTRYYGLPFYQYGMKTDLIAPSKPGDRCTVILRIAKDKLSAQRSSLWRVTAPRRTLGLCAYYAGFGIPGPRIRSWLHDAGWALSGDGSWTDAPLQYVPYYWYWDAGYSVPLLAMTSWTPSLINDVPMTGLACLRGDETACSRGATIGPTSIVAWNGDLLQYSPLIRGYRYRSVDPRLGDRSTMLLASMVRTLGRDKFQQFWTSSDSVAGALKTASGKNLGPWVHDWMVEQYGSVGVVGPSPSGWTTVCALVLIALGVFVAVRVSSGRQYV